MMLDVQAQISVHFHKEKCRVCGGCGGGLGSLHYSHIGKHVVYKQ